MCIPFCKILSSSEEISGFKEIKFKQSVSWEPFTFIKYFHAKDEFLVFVLILMKKKWR